MNKNDNATVGYVHAVMNQTLKKLLSDRQAEQEAKTEQADRASLGIASLGNPRRRIEFSKIAVIGITVFCMGCIAANYALAFREAVNVNEAVTISLVSTIFGTAAGYFVKSAFEKNSRNIHGIDEFGNKIVEPKSGENNGNREGNQS